MLTVKIPDIPEIELYDPDRNMFITQPGIKAQTLVLEHSLISISLWESKWKIPFLTSKKKTTEQTLDYIRCMTITKNVDPELYNRLPSSVIKMIQDYIDDPMTATTFTNTSSDKRNSRKIVTSEELYYDMAVLNIPFECEKWHLNRLITLIRIGTIRNQPQKKMSRKEIYERNAAWNKAQREARHSKG